MFTKRILAVFAGLLLITTSFVFAQTGLEGIKAYPPVHIAPRPPGIQPFIGPIPGNLSPSQVKAAYGLPSTGGSGTIAIIDAYDDPNIQNDFNVFSQQYGLPTATSANFQIYKMGATIGNASANGWDEEECLDTQWAHAIAPNSKILFVECTSGNGGDLLNGVIYAAGRSDVVAISMSFGSQEFLGESSYDTNFVSSYGATFFASAGDDSTGVNWPAVSVNVVGVGGTNLYFNSLSQVTSEVAWSGSGGGLSAFETEPYYQLNYGVLSANGFRAVPDVSYNGGTTFPVSVYDSYQEGWIGLYGTSAGAPQWAGIKALSSGWVISNPSMYQRASSPASYAADFRDITSGSNGPASYYTEARTGYDYITGLGSPHRYGIILNGCRKLERTKI
jgi:subtilase family serine protease